MWTWLVMWPVAFQLNCWPDIRKTSWAVLTCPCPRQSSWRGIRWEFSGRILQLSRWASQERCSTTFFLRRPEMPHHAHLWRKMNEVPAVQSSQQLCTKLRVDHMRRKLREYRWVHPSHLRVTHGYPMVTLQPSSASYFNLQFSHQLHVDPFWSFCCGMLWYHLEGWKPSYYRFIGGPYGVEGQWATKKGI